MARSKKKSLLGKLANWIKGSIEKFAAEGFSKEGRKKRSRAVPSFLRVKKRRAKSVKKKSGSKEASASRVAVKKKKPIRKPAQKPRLKRLPAVEKSKASSKVKTVLKTQKSTSMPPPRAKPPAMPKPGSKEKSPGVLVGKIDFYFSKANACAFQVQNAEIKEGCKIRILGPSTDFKMIIKTIQINRIPVPSGRPGEDIGIGVTKPVKVGDSVFLI